MTQVMNAHPLQPGARLDAVPVISEVRQAEAALAARDDPGIALDAIDAVQHLQDRRRQRHHARAPLGVAEPELARRAVHVVPAQGENFGLATAGQDHQADTVRRQRRRLYLRRAGQLGAARPRIRGGRRPQGAPRRGRRGQDAGASPPSPTPPGPGAANAGSSPGWRRPRAASTPATLSPRSAETPAISTKLSIALAARREPHQAAQGPARLRPDLLPEPDRQPVPPRPAHRKARPLEGHSRNPRAGMETGTTEDARRKRVEQRRFRFDDGCPRLWRSTVREIEPHQGLDIWPDTWRETRMQIRQKHIEQCVIWL